MPSNELKDRGKQKPIFDKCALALDGDEWPTSRRDRFIPGERTLCNQQVRKMCEAQCWCRRGGGGGHFSIRTPVILEHSSWFPIRPCTNLRTNTSVPCVVSATNLFTHDCTSKVWFLCPLRSNLRTRMNDKEDMWSSLRNKILYKKKISCVSYACES